MAYNLKHTGAEIDAQIGRVIDGSVVTDNTVSSIALGEAKPVSADAIAKELQKKVDKENGKGLSSNDYTNEEMAQVERVRNGSVVTDNTLSALDETSNNPVSGMGIASAIKEAISGIKVVVCPVVGGVNSTGGLTTTDTRIRIERVPINGSPRKIGIKLISNVATLSYLKFSGGYAAFGYNNTSLVGRLGNIAVDGDYLVFDYDGSYNNIIVAFAKSDNSTITETERLATKVEIGDYVYNEWRTLLSTINIISDDWLPIEIPVLPGAVSVATGYNSSGRNVSACKSNFVSRNYATAIKVEYDTIVPDGTFIITFDANFNLLGLFYGLEHTFANNVMYFRLGWSMADVTFDALTIKANIFYKAGSQFISPRPILNPYLKSQPSIPVVYTFRVPKNATSNIEDGVFEAVRYSDVIYRGRGIIRLPKTYSHDGVPTRLIIFANGSSVKDPLLSGWGDYNDYVKWLVAEGYAVADCAAWGYTDDTGSTMVGNNYWGVPHNNACVSAFYKTLCDNFNIKTDGVFIGGKSLGGLKVYGIPVCTTIPVKAICALAGVYEPLHNYFGYVDQDRFACYEDMSFEGLEKDDEGNYIGEAAIMSVDSASTEAEKYAYLLTQADKMRGTLAFMINSNWELTEHINRELYDTIVGNYKRYSNIPHLAIVSSSDVGLYRNAKNAHNAFVAGNGISYLREMPSSITPPHHAVDTSGPKITIVAKDGTTYSDIPVAWAEMLSFFKQYE